MIVSWINHNKLRLQKSKDKKTQAEEREAAVDKTLEEIKYQLYNVMVDNNLSSFKFPVGWGDVILYRNNPNFFYYKSLFDYLFMYSTYMGDIDSALAVKQKEKIIRAWNEKIKDNL